MTTMYGKAVTAALVLAALTMPRDAAPDDDGASTARRRAFLDQLMKVLPAEIPERGPVSRLDRSWSAWLERTGELPPDFDTMPSLPFLPDPLVIDEGGENIPVTTAARFEEKRDWIRRGVQHWITGTFPPPPGNLTAAVLDETTQPDGLRVRTVELRFGPDHAATLTLWLYIPPGDGPFPVFMTPGNGDYSWISPSQALRRGYMAVLYAACDARDDTEAYAGIWYPEYDFTRLMRRAWGCHRAVDYLRTLDIADPERIGLAGLSRDGKQSLMAAAFDERIGAVVLCSGGTGSEDPWRYTSDIFDNETIVQITTNFPYWIHPRMRFFAGREHKLPVDQNLMLALVAPRGLLISSSIFEDQGNPWGIEQNFLSAERVYRFLGVEDRIGLHLRHGLHRPAARDIEEYIDFFDTVFGRGDIPLPRRLRYNYSFSRWRGMSGESIDPMSFPVRGIDDILTGLDGGIIRDTASWERKRADIRTRVTAMLGEEPPATPVNLAYDHLRGVIGLPRLDDSVASTTLGTGVLFHPSGAKAPSETNRMPVVIYLHEYAYPTGFVRFSSDIIGGFVERGFCVFAFDQIGFGTRVEEGVRFHERFPHWSKLGRMVADTRDAVDELSRHGFIDPGRIYTAGYALGGTVGLYTAAMDDRIAGVVSVCGFTPMRTSTPDDGTEGIRAFSHLHGLIPRLGFFVGRETRIPWDYHELMASIAPRPVLVVAPTWDRYAVHGSVVRCVHEARRVYGLYGSEAALTLHEPGDYNRFSPEMLSYMFGWCERSFR